MLVAGKENMTDFVFIVLLILILVGIPWACYKDGYAKGWSNAWRIADRQHKKEDVADEGIRNDISTAKAD